MLIAFLIVASIVAAFFLVCGIAIGRAGRDHLRLELAHLKGKHETLSSAYGDMERIARESLKAAQARHFPQEQFPIKDSVESMERKVKSVLDSRPDYIAPEAKNCPICFVSVRAEAWPQPCPACGTLFGDEWQELFPLD